MSRNLPSGSAGGRPPPARGPQMRAGSYQDAMRGRTETARRRTANTAHDMFRSTRANPAQEPPPNPGDPPPLPEPPAAAAAAAAAPAPPAARQIVPYGPAVGNPTLNDARVMAENARRQHVDSRSTKTSESYRAVLPYWNSYCNATNGDVLKGGVVVRNKPDRWSDIVTPIKVCRFVQDYAIPRPAFNQIGGPPRGHSAIKADVSGLVDLHNDQMSRRTLEVMRTPGGCEAPRNGNVTLNNIMATHLQQEKNQSLVNPRGNSGKELCDGEQYSQDQHRQVCEFGLTKDGISAGGMDDMRAAMIRAYHCCGHYFLQRSEGRKTMHIRDAHMYSTDPGEGDQQMDLMVCHEDRSKGNQHGHLVRHGAARQRNDPIVDIIFQMSVFHFFRFTVRQYVPTDWTDQEAVHKWMNEYLFFPTHPTENREAWVTNSTGNGMLKKIYPQVDPPIKWYHVSHLGRKSMGKLADTAGVGRTQITRQGVWEIDKSVDKSYVNGFPMEMIRWSAGHGLWRGDYHVPRAAVQPSEEMILRVFPFMTQMIAANQANYDQWLQETIEVLHFSAVVLLQDIAVVYDRLDAGILQYDPFNTDEFRTFRDEVQEAVASDDAPDPSTFRSAATEIREAKKEIIAAVKAELNQAVGAMLAQLGSGQVGTPAQPRTAGVQPPPAPTPVLVREPMQGLLHRPTANVPPVQPRRTQDPSEVSTWRPRQPDLPHFAKASFDKLTTIEAFISEYAEGTHGRPPLKLIERYFGPGPKRGNWPSWRSEEVRRTQKYKVEWAKRKALYAAIDAGATAESLKDIVRNNNEELWNDKKKHGNGKLVRWLMRHHVEARPDFQRRRSKAVQRGETRRANIARRSAEAAPNDMQDVVVQEDDSDGSPAEEGKEDV